jgi:hypothetical protein
LFEDSPKHDIYMSIISGITSISSGSNSGLTSALQSNVNLTVKDFQSLGTALQSGNAATARAALTAFQKDLPAAVQSGTAQAFGTNSQANTHYQTLTTALKSGDLAGAQKAYALLQDDLKSSTGQSAVSSMTSTLSNLTGSATTDSTFGNILSKVMKVVP